MAIIDLTWKRFGRLIVCSYAGKRINGNTKWLCRCDCGNTVIALSTGLRNGSTKSCGCLQRKLAKEQNTTHGKSKTRLYSIWSTMKKRMTNPNCKAFARYGGRGLVLCSEWKESFESFFVWATNNGYNDNLSIDRINNNDGYSPVNCRWATRSEQMHNVTFNRWITFNGKTKILADWAKELGLTKAGLWSRIRRNGIEKALSMPRDRAKQHICCGIADSTKGWAIRLGMPEITLYNHIRAFGAEEAINMARERSYE